MRRRAARVPVVHHGQHGDTQTSAAGHPEERLVARQAGTTTTAVTARLIRTRETQVCILMLISRLNSCFVFQPRLKVLLHIVKRLEDKHRDFIIVLLPEVEPHNHTPRVPHALTQRNVLQVCFIPVRRLSVR